MNIQCLCDPNECGPFDSRSGMLDDMLDRLEDLRDGAAALKRAHTERVARVVLAERLRRTVDPVHVGEVVGGTLHASLLELCDIVWDRTTPVGHSDYEDFRDAFHRGIDWVAEKIAPIWSKELELRVELELNAASAALAKLRVGPARTSTRRPKGIRDAWACRVVDEFERQGRHDWKIADIAKELGVPRQTLSDKNRNGSLRYPELRKLIEARRRDRDSQRERMKKRLGARDRGD